MSQPSPIRDAGVPSHVKPLRIVLYVLTLVTAAAALFLEPALQGAVQRGALAPIWLFTPVGIYGVFFLVYAVDRAMLVRRSQYPAGRALFQVVFGIVFGLLLLPSTLGTWNSEAPEGPARLMAHRNPQIRLVTVEALGFRGRSPARAQLLSQRLADTNADVRGRAAEILSSWSGKSLTDLEGMTEWSTSLSRTSTTGAP